MGRPKFTPNCPFPFDDYNPHLIHPSIDRPRSIPKRHPDPISRFATVHFPDTHRQADRLTDRQMGYATGLRH